jgi:uncharacterized protein YqfA (UPF0365 family)
MSVLPKVIQTPKIAAVAKDGIQLIAVCLVTVRTNIDRLLGGAGEETIIARVGEGMVSTIGSSVSHKGVLEPGSHLQARTLQGAGRGYGLLDSVHRCRRCSSGREHRRQISDRPG